jgi:hypothetical protein
MEATTINSLEEVQQIFEYCRSRLPIMEGFQLEVSQNVVPLPDGEVVGIKGVHLKVFKGKDLIASATGIDEDDALLDIYKKLLYFYKSSENRQLKVSPALGKQHLSYK